VKSELMFCSIMLLASLQTQLDKIKAIILAPKQWVSVVNPVWCKAVSCHSRVMRSAANDHIGNNMAR
jgi:hypothetical protein